MDESQEPVSHWVAVYFARNGMSEYFDSNGLPPYPKAIKNFLQDNSVIWKYNSQSYRK